MTVLALVGAFVITAILVYGTVTFLATLYLQWGFGGFDVLGWQEWVIVAIIALVLTGLWIGWWGLIGTHIVIGVSYG